MKTNETVNKNFLAATDAKTREAVLSAMPPDGKNYFRPKGGWREHGWYICDVSNGPTNPVHRVLFYTGFLSESGDPAGYSGFIALNSASRDDYRFLRYLKPVYFIGTTDELGKMKTQIPVEIWSKK